MNNWGGARVNSGRPPKADEQELIEDLDGIIDRKEAIRLLYEQMQKGNMRALHIYFDRRYGKAMPRSIPETDALRRFEVEVIGGQRENVFKKIVENIRFENDTGET